MIPVSIRRTGVSSSKMDAILNKSKYRTVTEQYLIDTKQIEDVVTETGRQKMAMGHVMEPVIKELVEKELGVKLTVDKTRYQDEYHPLFTIEFDALDYENEVVYEFKNTERDEATLVETYYAQVQFAMYMIGWFNARICYLRNGWQLGYVDIKRDDNFIEYMVKAGEYYAECLEERIEPTPEVIDEIASHIEFYKQFEKGLRGTNEVIELTPDEIEALYQWQDVKNKIAALEVEEARFKGMFSEKYGKFSDGNLSYTNVEASRAGGIDITSLLLDHPEIDVRKYERPSTVYSRQMLRAKRRKEDKVIEKITEDIV